MQHATLYSKREQARMKTEHNIEIATWLISFMIVGLAIMIIMALVYNIVMGFI